MSADPLEGARGRWGHWSLMLNGLRALPLPYVVAMTVGDASEVATVSGAGATVLVLPGAIDQPARHFLDFSAEATCQVVRGRGYRILDIKPGTFE